MKKAPALFAGIALVLGLSAALSPARADNFTWVVDLPHNGGGFITGSGSIVTSGPLTSGGTLVTSISGMYDGGTITGLIPAGSFNGNDNRVFSGYPQLDGSGISFSVSGEADPTSYGSGVNVYYVPGSSGYTDNGATGYNPAGFVLTPALNSVPESGSTIALLALGCGALLLVSKRAQKVQLS